MRLLTCGVVLCSMAVTLSCAGVDRSGGDNERPAPQGSVGTDDNGGEGGRSVGEEAETGGADGDGETGGTGGAGESGSTSSAGAAGTQEDFASAWRQAVTGSGAESQSGGVPAPSEDGAPVILSAQGGFSEAALTFQMTYRSDDEAIRAAYVGLVGAGYRFHVLENAPASVEGGSLEFSLPLPPGLEDYATNGTLLELAVAIEDAGADVSNTVILGLELSLTAAGGVRGRVETTQLCDPDAPPSCHTNVAVSCADEGSAIDLNTCLSPEECLDGACVCPEDSCATEVRECGTSTCGAECGRCPTADGDPLRTFCNQAGLCTEEPAVVGCSDGTREGFLDRTIYPNVASCQAAWDTQSLRASYSNARPCGNSLGECIAPGDACADGWHPCLYSGQPADLQDRLPNPADCLSPIAGSAKFLIAACVVADREGSNCTAPLPCSTGYYSESLCCGGGCNIPNDLSNDCIWPDATGYGPACGSASSESDGILCCKDVIE